MKTYKLILGLFAILIALQGCTKGIVEDEVPEEYRSALNIAYLYGSARELFYDKMCGVNYDGAPLSNYVQQVSALKDGKDYMNVSAVLEKVEEAGVPGNELWRITVNVEDSVVYETPNNGWLFVKAEFDKDNSMNPSFIDLDANGRCRKVKLPVDIHRFVIGIEFDGDYHEYYNNEVAERIDGAPKLGVPGDFSEPRRYLIQNKWEMEDGTHMQRVVEIRVQYASNPKY